MATPSSILAGGPVSSSIQRGADALMELFQRKFDAELANAATAFQSKREREVEESKVALEVVRIQARLVEDRAENLLREVETAKQDLSRLTGELETSRAQSQAAETDSKLAKEAYTTLCHAISTFCTTLIPELPPLNPVDALANANTSSSVPEAKAMNVDEALETLLFRIQSYMRGNNDARTALQKRCDAVEAEQTSASSDLTRAGEERDTLQGLLQDAIQSHDGFRKVKEAEIAAVQTKLANIETDRDEVNRAHHATKEQHDKDISTKDTQITTSNAKIGALEAQIRDMEHRHAQVLSAKDADLAALNKQISGLIHKVAPAPPKPKVKPKVQSTSPPESKFSVYARISLRPLTILHAVRNTTVLSKAHGFPVNIRRLQLEQARNSTLLQHTPADDSNRPVKRRRTSSNQTGGQASVPSGSTTKTIASVSNKSSSISGTVSSTAKSSTKAPEGRPHPSLKPKTPKPRTPQLGDSVIDLTLSPSTPFNILLQ
jgi:predicted  nucleic acid-binding Zn-ribbon protein